VADHFYNADDEPILDETLDSARDWLTEFAQSRGLDLEPHYSSWNLRWIDKLGNDRSVQVSPVDKPYIRLGAYPHSWHDSWHDEDGRLERRHAHIARSFDLASPFSRELFEETLDLAAGDADATDPLHDSAEITHATWPPGIKPYRKPRPVR